MGLSARSSPDPCWGRGWLRVHLGSEEVAGLHLKLGSCAAACGLLPPAYVSPGGVACEVLGRQSDLKVQTPCSSGSSMPQTPKAPKPLILGPGSWRAAAQSSYEPVQVLAPTSIRPRRMGRAGAQELRYKAPNESSLTGDLAVDGSAQQPDCFSWSL